MPDIKAGLTKKVGPLPVWGYGVAVTGGLLGWKLLKGGGSKTEYLATPTGAPADDPSYPSSGAFSALIDRINDLENRGVEQPIPIANPTTPTLPRGPLTGIGGGRQSGGAIQPVSRTNPIGVKPMIPRSAKTTAPPPSSAPVRRAVPRILPAPRPQPVSATKPAPKAPLKRVTTVAKKVTPRAVKVAPKPVAVIRKPPTPVRRVAPKPAPRPLVKRPAVRRRPVSSVARPV